MLGVSAHLGRVFGPRDEVQGFAEAVVINDSLWAREFGKMPQFWDESCNSTKIRIRSSVFFPRFPTPSATVATDAEVWVAAGFRANPFPKQNAACE